MRLVTATSVAAVAAALALPAAAAARLAPPKLVGPANGAVFQQLPAISWQPVRRAAGRLMRPAKELAGMS